VVLFVLALLLALAVSLWVPRHLALTPAASRMLFILVFAALLWLSEAIPAFAVGLLVIALEILLLGRPGGVYAETSRDWENFVLILGHPLIWLFFRGFVIAAGIAKTRLDRTVARWVMIQFGAREVSLLAAVMALAFVFSMFMSNTATAAMMVAMMQPLLGEEMPPKDFAKALLLGVALGASLGGMATLIGSPPNAIAAGALAEIPGKGINFLQWACLRLLPCWGWRGAIFCYATPRATLTVLPGWRSAQRGKPSRGVASLGTDPSPWR
jgi:sodium-dependent dicarboxylate transporter 2/3/5